MQLERWVVLVSAVAWAAGCGGGGTTVVTSTVPPTAADGGVGPGGGAGPGGGGGATDGGAGNGPGAPDAGAPGTGDGGAGGGGTPSTPCSGTRTQIASGVVIGAADGQYLYGFSFSTQQIVRIPLGGGAREVVVDGVDTAVDFELTVDDRYVYWRMHGTDGQVPALVRAPKNGGATSVLGTGGGDAAPVEYVVADPIYFVHDGFMDAMSPDGSGQSHVVSADDAMALTANAHAVLYLGRNDGFRVHALPSNSAPSAHSVGSFDADDQYLYVAQDDELRRYAISDSHVETLGQFAFPNGIDELRLFDNHVYLLIGLPTEHLRIDRVATDGSGRTTIVDGVSSGWVVASDSVYFNWQGGVYRICR
ncbi:MAG: hypothetical protein JWN44_2512 [Myxococcales bacterium]|nr:hypothetical protein [Myxococcales bacterium]